MIKRILLSICLLLVIGIVVSCSSQKNTGQFTIENKSNELIKRAHIEICGQSFDIKDIKPQGEHKGSFVVKSDSHYNVTISFLSGKKLSKETGYVTHGFDYSHAITVTEGDISITDVKIE